MIWIWWNQGTTRKGSWSLVHRAAAIDAAKTSCGVVLAKGTYHRPCAWEGASPWLRGIACMRCLKKEGITP